MNIFLIALPFVLFFAIFIGWMAVRHRCRFVEVERTFVAGCKITATGVAQSALVEVLQSACDRTAILSKCTCGRHINEIVIGDFTKGSK